MSSKDSSKHLVGQPIFKQMIDFIPKDKFNRLVAKHQTDRYYRRFSSWVQLLTLLFGAFSRCDSMGEICDGMMGMQGKLQPLELDSSPAKSTAGDGLRDRDNTFFEAVYFMLLEHFKPILSVSRIDWVSFSKLFIFDSSTIRLFSQVMKGVGRKRQEKRRAKSSYDDRCALGYPRVCENK